MCDMDIHIVLKDREFNKIIEYSSLSANGEVFSIDTAQVHVHQFRQLMSKKFFRVYTDEDYEALKAQPRGADYLDE